MFFKWLISRKVPIGLVWLVICQFINPYEPSTFTDPIAIRRFHLNCFRFYLKQHIQSCSFFFIFHLVFPKYQNIFYFLLSPLFVLNFSAFNQKISVKILTISKFSMFTTLFFDKKIKLKSEKVNFNKKNFFLVFNKSYDSPFFNS